MLHAKHHPGKLTSSLFLFLMTLVLISAWEHEDPPRASQITLKQSDLPSKLSRGLCSAASKKIKQRSKPAQQTNLKLLSPYLPTLISKWGN